MVRIEGLERILREHPFFEGLSADYQDLFAGCAANERFEAGGFVGREGEPANKFYLVRHGIVALEYAVPARPPLVLETLEEGDVFGWSWMVPPHTWAFDVRAMTLVRLISLDAECLRGKFESDHRLGYELFRRFVPVVAKRLAAARMRLLDMYDSPK